MLDSTLRIVLVGGREFTRHILHDLVNSSYTVSGVVTPSAKNRSNRVGYVSMSEVCSTEDITHIKTDNINDNESKKEIQELEPDVILCCGWTQIISETVLDIPKK
jgi:methionyl-tRNA formyltransferase